MDAPSSNKIGQWWHCSTFNSIGAFNSNGAINKRLHNIVCPMALHKPTVSPHLLHGLAYMQLDCSRLPSGPTASSADGAQASCTQLNQF